MKDQPLTDFDKAILEQMARIRAIGRRKLRNQGELDDFVQETIARAYANRAKLRNPAKLKQWIGGIARNTAKEWNRAHERWNGNRQTLKEAEAETANAAHPLTALLQEESNEQIRQALDRLNPIDRDLLRGRYMNEETYEALQNRHGLSYSAVGIRLHRAKRRLRKVLTGMKVALALALANMKRTAFGRMLIMTNATKIVLGVASALILALLGGYLWIEYGGSSDDSGRGLTVEEQSPRMDTGPAADAADDSSVETESSADSEASQTPEAERAVDNGGAEDTATASPDASASLDIPDAFSIQLREGIQEIIDYAATMKAQAPELAPVADAELASVEGLAELDAQLRRQGMELEERRTQLRKKFFKNSLEGAYHMLEGGFFMTQSGEAFDSERVAELSQIRSASPILSASPTKLSTLLDGMSDQEFMEMPEVRATIKEMEQR